MSKTSAQASRSIDQPQAQGESEPISVEGGVASPLPAIRRAVFAWNELYVAGPYSFGAFSPLRIGANNKLAENGSFRRQVLVHDLIGRDYCKGSDYTEDRIWYFHKGIQSRAYVPEQR
jgi:hypothetical protein